MRKSSILSLLTLALTSVCAFTISTSLNNRSTIKASAFEDTGIQSYPYVDPTLPVSDNDNLYISLDNITKTSSGESFTISFGANTVLYPVGTTGTNKYKETNGVYVTPFDDNFPANTNLNDLTKYDVDINNITGKEKNVKRDADGNVIYGPDGRPELVDGHGFIHEMPSYNAIVSIIDCTNFAKRGIDEVVIPYSITYGSWYQLLVTGIADEVIYNTTSGSYLNPYSTLKKVVLGENIETVAESAFINSPADFTICTQNSELPSGWSADMLSGEGSIVFDYEPSEHEKEIFDTSEKKDSEGNVIYYDDTGAVVDSEGYYLDEDGNRIVVIDDQGQEVYLHFDGEIKTTFAAYRFSAGTTKNLQAEKTFMIGIIDDEKGLNYPLLMSYDVNLPDGTVENRIIECPLNSPDLRNYDAVGSLAGVYSVAKVIDIRLNDGEDIDYTTVMLYNIFEAKVDSSSETYSIIPDFGAAYKGIPSLALSRKNNISDFFNIKFDSVKTVFGYTSISLKFDCVDGAYQQVKEKKYNEKKSGILDGTYKIRYSIRGFNAASYNITTKDDNNTVVRFDDSVQGGIPGELDYYVMTKANDNVVTFLLQDSYIKNGFNANNMKSVEICGFNVTLDICPTKKGTTQVISQSAVSFRFGFFELLPKDYNSSAFDGNVFLIIYFISFIILYTLGVGAYYVYARKVFKNDEFRRMNTKAYLKRVSIGFIGATFIVGAIAFIILRFALISPTIAVFNPMDPCVIVFGVGGLISLGFFIKFLVVTIKQEKQRRKNIKLKLGEDAVDDGTK